MNRGFLFERRLVLGLRILLGLIFLFAGAMKLKDPESLVKSIEAYRLLPPEVVPWVASSLPIFELIVGLFLVTGWRWRVGALSACFLLLIFLVALVSALIRGISIECSCFGTIAFLGVTPEAMLVRNSLLFLIAIFCYVAGFKRRDQSFAN